MISRNSFLSKTSRNSVQYWKIRSFQRWYSVISFRYISQTTQYLSLKHTNLRSLFLSNRAMYILGSHQTNSAISFMTSRARVNESSSNFTIAQQLMNASWHADLATGVLTKLLFYENVKQWLFKKENDVITKPKPAQRYRGPV